MSGLCAIFSRQGKLVKEQEISEMLNTMTYRGPDRSGQWIEGVIGLGHCMLQTTPESLIETLPFHDPESGLVIVADARIDNRQALIGKLDIEKALRKEITDSQLILRSYKKWQKDCVHHLIGDFAFIIWDRKKQILFCARDHLGVKPFYYYLDDRMVVIASEVGAILKVPDVPRQINEARIVDFMVIQLEGIDNTSTFYNKIYRLPPAHIFSITDNNILIRKYWEPDSGFETSFKSDEEYVEAFRELLTDSVKARLRCNHQPASMLSGGIDSSTIVGVTNHLLTESGMGPLNVFSGIKKNGQKCRESHFISSVISHCGLQSFTVTPEEFSKFDKELNVVLNQLEEPFDGHMILLILMYLLAKRQGHHVILDGVEGDIVHSLSPSYPVFLLKSGKWFRAFTEIRGLCKNYYQGNHSIFWIILDSIRALIMTEKIHGWRHRFLRDSQIRKILNNTRINSDFAFQMDIKARLRQLYAYNEFCSTSRKSHIQNITHPYLSVALERYDRIAARCGVEPRHPLLDKRLVEFSISLPLEQLVRNGWSKFIMRRAGEKYLPHEVVWRKGWEHLGTDFSRELFNKQYKNILNAIIIQRASLNRYVDSSFLDRVMEVGYTTSEKEKADIWHTFQLANWLEQRQLN